MSESHEIFLQRSPLPSLRISIAGRRRLPLPQMPETDRRGPPASRPPLPDLRGSLAVGRGVLPTLQDPGNAKAGVRASRMTDRRLAETPAAGRVFPDPPYPLDGVRRCIRLSDSNYRYYSFANTSTADHVQVSPNGGRHDVQGRLRGPLLPPPGRWCWKALQVAPRDLAGSALHKREESGLDRDQEVRAPMGALRMDEPCQRDRDRGGPPSWATPARARRIPTGAARGRHFAPRRGCLGHDPGAGSFQRTMGVIRCLDGQRSDASCGVKHVCKNRSKGKFTPAAG